MLAAASDLHDVRFFSLPAVLATVLAAFFGRTVACPMSTLSNFISHRQTLLVCLLGAIQVVGGCFTHARPHRRSGQEERPETYFAQGNEARRLDCGDLSPLLAH